MQEFPEIAVQHTAENPTEVTVEITLTQEIAHLWSIHSQAQTVLGRTKEELESLRLELGRRLYEMKLLLARPGRSGEWSKFLSAQHIVRATADRWAKTHELALNPPAEIASSEAIQEPADETVRKLLRSTWPKLSDRLKDRETAYEFLSMLVQRCDTLQAEITDLGIAIRKPTTINSEFGPAVPKTEQVIESQNMGCE